jgi:hypothetical protein
LKTNVTTESTIAQTTTSKLATSLSTTTANVTSFWNNEQTTSSTLKTTIKTAVYSSTTKLIQSSTFKDCNFKFGILYNGDVDFTIIDYAASWIGQYNNGGFGLDPNTHLPMLRASKNYKKPVVYYAYFIENMAKQLWKLKDCNYSNDLNLCNSGSDFIRYYKASIIKSYNTVANQTATIMGRNSEILWLIEPNFWRYYGIASQHNGPLSGNYVRSLFDEIIKTIKKYLPKSLISWDIQKELSRTAMQIWWRFFSNSSNIDFIHTSGGESIKCSDAISESSNLTWKYMNSLTGKKILADTGYVTNSHSDEWDNIDNLKARISDGVLGVTQYSARNEDWKKVLSFIRTNLTRTC